MQSHIQIQLDAIQPEILTLAMLSDQSTIPLRMTKAKKFTINEGQIIIQSTNHYLAYIEVFEYSLLGHATIEFSVNEPTFFMYANLNKNSCYLGYHPTGRYKETILAGTHQIMLITFRPEWLIHKCQRLAELQPFTTFFLNHENRKVNLPAFGIARNLFQSLKRMDTAINELNMDTDGYIFINGCINKYYNKLIGLNATNHHYQYKSAAIARFINEHFASELANDVPKLAAKFMLSERSLARLAKIAFGNPLHEQVIKLRMQYSLNLLLTTSKPIYEVAKLSGYQEAHYFSKAFKKYFGRTPRQVDRVKKNVA